MTEGTVKHPALLILEDERHRVILAIDFGTCLRQHGNRPIPRQTGVHLVIRREGFQAFGNRMNGGCELNLERPSRIMSTELGIPGASGQIAELGPVLESAAGEVKQYQ